ncbi:MAG TPA: TerC family protein [Alphaproteobacteria bacterium]
MQYLFDLAASPGAWAALATLTAMEVVLGIDNLIFISILTNRLPEHQRALGRRVGIGLALILRLALLGSVAYIARLTEPIVTLFDHAFSWRDLIMLAGGVFLLWKATIEIHHRVDPTVEPSAAAQAAAGFAVTVAQILVFDLVFSIDSILTAVGMTTHFPIMVVAVLIAVAVMMFAATPVADFIHANPTVVMLALGFLMMIGMLLLADGFGVHVPKGYVYAAMAFSALVEALNMLARRARQARARGTAAAP